MKNTESNSKPISPHAIIVEDNFDLAQSYKYALTQAGYFVQVIHNGRRALKHLKSVSPRLLFLDLHLPELDGNAILDEIRALPAYADTKIILISTSTNLGWIFGNKVDLVLEKPVSIKMLTELALRYHPTQRQSSTDLKLPKSFEEPYPIFEPPIKNDSSFLSRIWEQFR